MEYRIPQYITVMKGETVPRLEIKRIVVHAAVTEIASGAFRGWASLEEVVFEPGSRLRRIRDYAFTGTALKVFTTPKRLKEIGNGAFTDCK